MGAFTFFRCTATGFIFANPRLSTRAAKKFFADQNLDRYFATVEATIAKRREMSYVPLADRLRKLLPEKSRILEVGCGTGALLELLRDYGKFAVEGVEIAPGARRYWGRRGLTVHTCAIEEMEGAGLFDGIVMWSVADHFSDPVAVLRACHRLLAIGGTIFIGNVNTDGFDIATIGSDSLIFAPPGRVNFYNIRSLTDQLSTAGFEIADIQTPGKLDVSIVREYWQDGGQNGRTPFLEQLILSDDHQEATEVFQEFLIGNKMSGFQTVLGTKPS